MKCEARGLGYFKETVQECNPKEVTLELSFEGSKGDH